MKFEREKINMYSTWIVHKAKSMQNDEFDEVMQQVAKNTVHLRKQLRYSSHGLSRAMGEKGMEMTFQYINDIENNRRGGVHFKKITALANFFGVTLKEFLFENLEEKYR